MQKRLYRVIKPTVIILAIGFIYIIIHRLTGFTLFCPYYQFLHIYCPGCGISRMFFHLAKFEFAEAFSSNCVIFCMLPIALIMALYHAYRYIRYGKTKLNKAENILVYAAITILLVFAVVRNLYPIDILVP